MQMQIVKLFEKSNERMFMQKRINLNKTTSHRTNIDGNNKNIKQPIRAEINFVDEL